MTAIEQLTSQLCDLELAVGADELIRRPGPFHRALAHLPVRFTPLDTLPDDDVGTGPDPVDQAPARVGGTPNG
ncbi:hypothetical protein NKH18_39160 [Streptomyces sp. M10(2022)]